MHLLKSVLKTDMLGGSKYSQNMWESEYIIAHKAKVDKKNAWNNLSKLSKTGIFPDNYTL